MTLGAGSALAGNVDRSGQSSMLLFEPGGYAEFYIRRVSPDVSGVGAGSAPSLATPTPGQSSGDMAGGYNNVGAGVKTQLQDGLDAALILDQPFGANTLYPTDTRYYARGTIATLDTNAMTALLRYRFPSNVSLFGGLRYQTFSASAVIPFAARYNVSADEASSWGYVLGAAWEKPEIAARVALTYNSAIDYDLSTTETSLPFGTQKSTTPVTTPQSVNLDFETGVAADTLLFGGVRWVDWTEFDISPAMYQRITTNAITPQGRALVSYDSDVYTYTLGVGRRFNETWSGALSLTHEQQVGGYASNLGPTDGLTSVNVGGTYTQGPMEVSAGVSYIWIGSAETTINTLQTAGIFEDNTGVGFGMRIAYRF
jgi:long-subunit fatty acid transport protein